MLYFFKHYLGIIALMFIIPATTLASHSYQNDTIENVITKFDEVSYQWDLVSEDLEEYEGLSEFCLEKSYRTDVIKLLEEVHHFDSLIYFKLKDLSVTDNSGEIKKTLKQIEELESEFSIREFSKFLNQECRDRKKIEKDRKDLSANIGQDGYDGQQQLLENKLYRYIHHVTYLVDHIRKHIHHLHLEEK